MTDVDKRATARLSDAAGVNSTIAQESVLYETYYQAANCTMQSNNCLGHEQREERVNKIKKLLKSSPKTLDGTHRMVIKKGPVSVETSLKELEENYAKKPEWKVIEEGGVLSIPVEEFRMINLPKPEQS